MLDALGAGQAPKIGDKDWGEIWRSSTEPANVKEEIFRIKAERVQSVGTEKPTKKNTQHLCGIRLK